MITAKEARELSETHRLPPEIFEGIKERASNGFADSEFVVHPDNDKTYYESLLRELGYAVHKHEVYDRHTYLISW